MNARHISLHALLVLLLAVFAGDPAFAQKAKAEKKSTALVDAGKAWEEGDLPTSGELYDKALKEGGLAPVDVLTAYVRLGTVYAAMKDDNKALSSFRIATLLNPDFQLPSEAGRKASDIFKRARKDAEQYGGKLEVKATIPEKCAAGESILVVATVADAYVLLLSDIQVLVQDPSVSTSTVKPWTDKKQAAEEVQFDIPGTVMTGGTTLLIRVDGMDQYGNRWVSTSSRIAVEAAVNARLGDDEGFLDDDPRKDSKKSGGFWSSPWPWVIGGAILVGAGTATYFAVRPSNDTSIGSPQWRWQ